MSDRQRTTQEQQREWLRSVKRAQERSGQPVSALLPALALSPRTYYRWRAGQERAAADGAARAGGKEGQRVPPPTPEEVQAVCAFAKAHPEVGYKRLTWLMEAQQVAFLRPYQVYALLKEQGLLIRRERPSPLALQRPPAPDHPDQVWHLDLMYLCIGRRWFYLVDILDGYSRYLVHWSLNATMRTETVTLTVQEALETLTQRAPGEPQLIHDHGSQFISAEWKAFVTSVGSDDILTRVAHPQSNGKLERLHRTHREEGLAGEALEEYRQTVAALVGWEHTYNHERPHSALSYLRPVDYYRGDPAARLAERRQRLEAATVARAAYWEGTKGSGGGS